MNSSEWELICAAYEIDADSIMSDYEFDSKSKLLDKETTAIPGFRHSQDNGFTTV